MTCCLVAVYSKQDPSDRILCKVSAFIVDSIEIIGKESVPSISQHLGIVLNISLSAEKSTDLETIPLMHVVVNDRLVLIRQGVKPRRKARDSLAF